MTVAAGNSVKKAALWPPAPRVASMMTAPGVLQAGAKSSRHRSRRTGMWGSDASTAVLLSCAIVLFLTSGRNGPPPPDQVPHRHQLRRRGSCVGTNLREETSPCDGRGKKLANI